MGGLCLRVWEGVGSGLESVIVCEGGRDWERLREERDVRRDDGGEKEAVAISIFCYF